MNKELSCIPPSEIIHQNFTSDEEFKKEARKLALDHAQQLAKNSISSYDTESLLNEAGKIYKWLTKEL